MYKYTLNEIFDYVVDVNKLTIWCMLDLYTYNGYCRTVTNRICISFRRLTGYSLLRRDSVTQDNFHFDTVFGNLIYDNTIGYWFIAYLNVAVNGFINSVMSTSSPSECAVAAAA